MSDSNAAGTAAAQALLESIAQRAADIVMARLASQTSTPSSTTPATGSSPASSSPASSTVTAPTSSMTVVAAAEAREGQSARFHLVFGAPGSDTLTIGGTAQDSDFDRPLLTALVQEAARYSDTVSVAVAGNVATVTWKTGAPAYLEVAVNCRVYHRRDGDRTIVLTTSAGSATMSVRNNTPAITSLQDLVTDYAAVVLDLSPTGTGVAVGSVAGSLSQSGISFAAAGSGGPTQTADGLRFTGTQGLTGTLPSAFQAAMKEAVCYHVFVVGSMDAAPSNFSGMASLSSAGALAGYMGITDAGVLGWKTDACSRAQTAAVGSAAVPVAVYGYAADEMGAAFRVNEDAGTEVLGDDNLTCKTLPCDALSLGHVNVGWDVWLKGEVRAVVLVPAWLDPYQRQKVAKLLADAHGAGDVTVWPLLCDQTAAMPQAPYHFAALTADPYTVDPKGVSYQNTRGTGNRYGSYHVLDQCNAYAFNINTQKVRDLLSSNGVAPIVSRNDDPAGGLELWVRPCPDSVKPKTILSPANAYDNGVYNLPGNDLTGVGTNGATFLACHIDTAPIFDQPGGARITEYRAAASSHAGMYNAVWAGSPTGWPPESDENESGLTARQLNNFGHGNYWWGVQGDASKPTGDYAKPAYRCPDWPTRPAQLARAYSQDRTTQWLFVNGVCVSGPQAMNADQKDEPWYTIVNTDTTMDNAGAVIGGVAPPADLVDSITLRSIRYLNYAG